MRRAQGALSPPAGRLRPAGLPRAGSASLLEPCAVLAALARYRARVLPAARGELRRWEERAAAVPDPSLRDAALSSIREKAGNPEAIAVFALLAPRGCRRAALRAMVALQVAIDYLDTLSEAPGASLRAALQLHGALEDALDPGGGNGNWYAYGPEGDDGGYLAALVGACREAVAGLPAADVALPAARRAAARCGQGQSHTHTAAQGDTSALRDWAEGLAAEDSARPLAQRRWWELAAGASSSVAAHALIAAAADGATTAAECALIDAAYFPAIGALTVILDDLVDREEDRASAQHSYLSYYESADAAAAGLAALAGEARAAVAPLRRRRTHAAILAGVGGYYLGAAGAESDLGDAVREPLLDALGPAARLVMATTRRRRRG